MHSSNGLKLIESCLDCPLRSETLFCELPDEVLRDFDSIKYASSYPKGAVLFVEGQSARGIFLLCAGRAKLSICSKDGKASIMRIAEPGEILGLSATISGKPYKATAETVSPCQVTFVKREDFLQFLGRHGGACLRVVEHLSNYLRMAYDQVRTLALSHSAAEKVAKLLLKWCEEIGEETESGVQFKISLTHEEMAEMLGLSRETVTRLLSELREKHLIEQQGPMTVVRDKQALESMVLP